MTIIATSPTLGDIATVCSIKNHKSHKSATSMWLCVCMWTCGLQLFINPLVPSANVAVAFIQSPISVVAVEWRLFWPHNFES